MEAKPWEPEGKTICMWSLRQQSPKTYKISINILANRRAGDP